MANGHRCIDQFRTNGLSSCQNTSWPLKLTMPAGTSGHGLWRPSKDRFTFLDEFYPWTRKFLLGSQRRTLVGEVWQGWRGSAETRQRREGVAPGAAGQRAQEDPEASGRRWRPSIWLAKTSFGFTPRPCGDGCWPRVCGSGRAKRSRIASGANAERTLGSWCRWTAASTTGIRSAQAKRA